MAQGSDQEQLVLSRTELVGETLVLQPDINYWLGPDLVCRDCQIILKVAARWLSVPGARFIGCRIQAKRELKNFRGFLHASLEQCTLSGSYSGVDFGTAEDEPGGAVVGCDFSQAHLDGCRLRGCDPASVVLPGWPHITFLRPLDQLDSLRRRALGEKWGVFISSLEMSPPDTTALVMQASTLAEWTGAGEEELRAGFH